jgi:SRSO17 transposase
LIDRELYPPKAWTEDRKRCTEAGIGDEVDFATKPELARRMLQRLLETGMGIGWFTTDEAYEDNPGLRTWLADVGLNLRPSLTTPNWCVRLALLPAACGSSAD